MKQSAGFFILLNDKVLLAHPTNSNWVNSFQIPKGHIEKGETPLEAAVRETFEEVGIQIEYQMIQSKYPIVVDYAKKGNIYKQVFCFVAKINQEPEIKLQLEEMDWAKFVSYKEAKDKMFWRFQETLDFVFANYVG